MMNQEPVSLRDDIAIRRVIAEYCFCLDQGRFGDLGRLFTASGTWEATYGAATGPEQIEVFLTGLIPPSPRRRHFVTNIIIDPEGEDSARAISYYLVIRESETGPAVSVAGTYEDRLERDASGAWRFAYRLLKPAILGDMGLMR